MRDFFKSFRDKYKVSKIPVVDETKINKEEEAKKLTMNLNMLFVAIPLLKPYGEEPNKVKLSQQHIDIILEVINSNNELIKNCEYYNDVIQILRGLIANKEEGIEINSTFISDSRKIQKFYYTFQDEKYWNEKSF